MSRCAYWRGCGNPPTVNFDLLDYCDEHFAQMSETRADAIAGFERSSRISAPTRKRHDNWVRHHAQLFEEAKTHPKEIARRERTAQNMKRVAAEIREWKGVQ